MSLELHAVGHFHPPPLSSDSKSRDFEAQGSKSRVRARTAFLSCSSEVKTRALLSEIDSEETALC